MMKAGDWPLSALFARWPIETTRELATFEWPIRSDLELDRLMACQHVAPEAVVAYEFSNAVRTAYEDHWRRSEITSARVAISVDLRTSLVPGPHVCMDVRLVLGARRWKVAFLHPPCTHQVKSDTKARRHTS